MKKRRKWPAVLLAALAVLIGVAVYFFGFTAPGYRMAVAAHGFDEVAPNLYVDRGWAGDADALRALVRDAQGRVRDYFGETCGAPTVIVCDDEAKLKRLGGDHDTITMAIFGARSYISVSPKWLSVDVLAHELTHAEAHARAFSDGLFTSSPMPTWFDEGLGIQNDYREQYGEAAWLELTNGGQDVLPIASYDTADKFYAGTADDRRSRYCLAGHEVRTWVEQNGKEALLELLDRLKAGEEFSKLYFGA